MFNIRRNRKGFTLVELIVVIAILAILAGTAAGIGVTLINKNTNKSAQSEVNLLVDDFKQTVLEWETDGGNYDPEGTGDKAPAKVVKDLLTKLMNSLALDSKQAGKIGTSDTEFIEVTGSVTIPTVKGNLPKAGEHKFVAYYELVEENTTSTPNIKAHFEVTFICAAKGKFDGADVISATYTYAPSFE